LAFDPGIAPGITLGHFTTFMGHAVDRDGQSTLRAKKSSM
jgi:hypothetical protein